MYPMQGRTPGLLFPLGPLPVTCLRVHGLGCARGSRHRESRGTGVVYIVKQFEKLPEPAKKSFVSGI